MRSSVQRLKKSLNKYFHLFPQIIDSIIEESQKGGDEEVGEVAQLLDQLHVDVKAGAEPKEEPEINAQEVPAEAADPAVEPQLVDGQEERQERDSTNGAYGADVPEHVVLPDSPLVSNEVVQPPDITSTIRQSIVYEVVVVGEGEQEQSPADLLDEASLADRAADSDSSIPAKPPRQFTVEPDIVASTKKPPPSRPPPPSGGPPPRPPPPSWQRPSGLDGRGKKKIFISTGFVWFL